MFVTWRALNGRHQATAMCDMGEERRWKREWEEEARRITAVGFHSYGRPLVAVSKLKCLVRVLTDSDYNWPVVVVNFRKVRKR